MADDYLELPLTDEADKAVHDAEQAYAKEGQELADKIEADKKKFAEMKKAYAIASGGASATPPAFTSNRTIGRIKSLQEAAPSGQSQKQRDQEASDKRVREAQMLGLKTAWNATWKGVGNIPASFINSFTDLGAAILRTDNALKIELPYPYDNEVEAEAAQDVQNVAQVATAVVGAVRAPKVGAGTYVAKVTKFTKNGYTYELDELGRVKKVEGDLTLNKSQGRNSTAQLEAGGADRLPTDQGGHYIGRRFDGPMDDFNHFAQNGNFNNGAYKSLENSWQRALESGKSVSVEITPSYTGSSLRPDSLTVRQWIDNIPSDPIRFGNNFGGKL